MRYTHKEELALMKHDGEMKQSDSQATSMPPVPLTLEGWSMLHQMFRIRWTAWRALAAQQQKEVIEEASAALSEMEQRKDGQSAIFYAGLKAICCCFIFTTFSTS